LDRPIWQIKQELCEVGKRIWQKGFCAGNEGNHSERISEDRVLCTPTGISKGFLDPEDICLVDMDGTQVEDNSRGRKRTSEVKVHLAIYKKKPTIKAVIHSHPPHATVFAIAGIPLPAGIHPEAEVFLGIVPLAPYATPSKQDLPDSITPLIGPETNSVLMGNHGTVSFSFSLIDTYYKLEILDAYCRILLLCKQLGKANVLNPSQMTELLEVKQSFGLPDARLECSPEGCVTQPNQPYFAQFEPVPATAVCGPDGNVSSASRASSLQPAQMGGACDCGGNTPCQCDNSAGNAAFESMVQNITNQIMAAAG
jgi:L-fuculose-phosphate aldolase